MDDDIPDHDLYPASSSYATFPAPLHDLEIDTLRGGVKRSHAFPLESALEGEPSDVDWIDRRSHQDRLMSFHTYRHHHNHRE